MRKRTQLRKQRYYNNGKRCSKGEKRIAIFLDHHRIFYKQEYSFSDCRSPKNGLLRFDFFLPEFNICIEFQGHHHYNPVNKGRLAKYRHEKTVIHDKIKVQYTINNYVHLVEIAHWEYEDIEKILGKLLKVNSVYNDKESIKSKLLKDEWRRKKQTYTNKRTCEIYCVRGV
ncbi:hypothetical protein KAR91_73105 [Candidatus Pacearchaeota archaeon]|nr:hypothetical protein [Candidatus Pacearchaeota archaeon]